MKSFDEQFLKQFRPVAENAEKKEPEISGDCARCGEPNTRFRSDICRPCATIVQRELARKKYHDRIAEGACVDCAGIPRTGGTLCKNCLDKRATRARNNWHKKK